jgi:hypothetical protein
MYPSARNNPLETHQIRKAAQNPLSVHRDTSSIIIINTSIQH